MNKTHLNEQDLFDYVRSNLPFAERLVMSRHLSDCTLCQKTLSQIAPKLDEEIGRNFLLNNQPQVDKFELLKQKNIVLSNENCIAANKSRHLRLFEYFKKRLIMNFKKAKGGFNFSENSILDAEVTTSSGSFATKGLHLLPIILMDGSSPDNTNEVNLTNSIMISPINEIVATRQPTLSWQAVPDAVSYHVSVFSCRTNLKVDGNLIETDKLVQCETIYWQVQKKLEPGEVYAWQVRVHTPDSEIKFPRLPVREIRFQVAISES